MDNTPPIAKDFKSATLDSLINEFVPTMPDEAVQQLQEIISRAQTTPPTDKASFITKVGRLMEAHRIRAEIEIEGKTQFARLAIRNGSIQFAPNGRGGGRSFQSSFKIVRVPEDYGRRRTVRKYRP